MPISNKNHKKVCLIADKEGMKHLKSKGINISKFFRQAVEAHKKGKFIYKHLDK